MTKAEHASLDNKVPLRTETLRVVEALHKQDWMFHVDRCGAKVQDQFAGRIKVSIVDIPRSDSSSQAVKDVSGHECLFAPSNLDNGSWKQVGSLVTAEHCLILCSRSAELHTADVRFT